MAKIRLDVALVEQGFAQSREKAKALIMSGIVFVNNQKSDKAGNTVKADDLIEVRGETLKYVSRGGLKLEKAVNVFDFSLKDKICADIQQNRTLKRIGPIIIMCHTAKTGFNSSYNNWCILISSSNQISINSSCPVRTLSDFSTWSISIRRTVLFRNKIMIHHRIHISCTD